MALNKIDGAFLRASGFVQPFAPDSYLARQQALAPLCAARKNQGGWAMEVVLHDA